MNQPRRFKDTSTLTGHCMTAGSEEKPPTLALQRAAETLGIPLSVLAAVTSTASANATNPGAAENVPSSVATNVSNASVSGLTTILAKGAIFGLGGGLLLFTVIGLVRSMAPSTNRTTSAAPIASNVTSQQGIHRPTPTTATQREAVPQFGDTAPAPLVRPLVTPSEGAPSGLPSSRQTNHEGRMKSANGSGVAPLTRNADELPIPKPPDKTQDVVSGTELPSRTTAPANIRLAREVKSVDQTRALMTSGDAAGALRELDSFDRQFGYSILQREATLVRIDVLLTLGRNTEATTLARRLLATSTSGEQTRLEKQLGNKGLSL